MQYRPTAAELLADIAALLEGEVLTSVSGPLQHRVRVAANLARIVERELVLGPASAAAEERRLAAVLGRHGTLEELRAELSARLLDPAPLSAGDDRAIFDTLLATARDDLAIAKPGHDEWEGE